jgi:hypothetical protein
MVLHNTGNIIFFFISLFHRGSKGSVCLYSRRDQILACSTRSPESLLENRQYCTRVTRGRQTFLVTLPSAICTKCLLLNYEAKWQLLTLCQR